MQNRGTCQGWGFVFVLLLAGCGKARTSPVEGEVLLDGKPLAGASVQFIAQGKGHDATGEADQAGRFAISTFQPKDGAMPGTYKVVISPPAGPADTTKYATAEEAMAATKSPAKKDIAAKVFPEKYSRPDQTPLTQEVPVKGKLVFELKN